MNIIIFTGGESPNPELTSHFFTNITFDYVIAADSGLETLDLYNDFYEEKFSPNIILGDMDSLKDKSLLEKYKNSQTKFYKCDKDYTDSELALIHAREISSNANVVLVGGNGGCIDHFLALYDSFSESFHANVWLCLNQIVLYLGEKETVEISNLKMEDKLSVARLTCEFKSSKIIANGLEWSSFKKKGMASISNRISKENFDKKKPISIFAKKGSCLVCFPYHCEYKIL